MPWKTLNLPLLVLLLLTVPAKPTTRPTSSSMNGVSDFELSVNRMVGRDGFIRKQTRSFKWVVRFKQDGEKLTGDLIGAKGSRGEGVCADASIDGTIRRESVSLAVTYQGACCSQEQENFTGTLSDDGKTLSGSIEPADVPTTYCTLAYADVKATKR
jgi:hypothetical protein